MRDGADIRREILRKTALEKKMMPEILAEEARLLAQKDDIMTAMVAEMTAQREGWSFSCRRFGDFMSVEIERRGNPGPKPWPHHPAPPPPNWSQDDRQYAATFNLGRVSSIQLQRGEEPNFTGCGWVRVETVRRAECPNGPWSASYDVSSWHASAPTHRPLFAIKPNRRELSFSAGEDFTVRHRVDGMPREAIDDQVRIVGWDTLLVPTGFGAAVLAALQAELARGCPVGEGATQ